MHRLRLLAALGATLLAGLGAAGAAQAQSPHVSPAIHTSVFTFPHPCDPRICDPIYVQQPIHWPVPDPGPLAGGIIVVGGGPVIGG